MGFIFHIFYKYFILFFGSDTLYNSEHLDKNIYNYFASCLLFYLKINSIILLIFLFSKIETTILIIHIIIDDYTIIIDILSLYKFFIYHYRGYKIKSLTIYLTLKHAFFFHYIYLLLLPFLFATIFFKCKNEH